VASLKDHSIIFSSAAAEQSRQYAALGVNLQQTVKNHNFEARVLRLRTKEHEMIMTTREYVGVRDLILPSLDGDFLLIALHTPH